MQLRDNGGFYNAPKAVAVTHDRLSHDLHVKDDTRNPRNAVTMSSRQVRWVGGYDL